MKKDNNNKKIGIIAIVFLLLLIVMGATYAYWTTTKIQEDENVIGTTCLSLTLTSVTDGISLEKTYPISDSEGMSTPGYTFRLSNTCDGYIGYTVNLESLSEVASEDRIASQYINAVLDDSQIQTISAYNNGESLLSDGVAYETKSMTTGVLAPFGQEGSTKTYVLRTWVDKNAPTTMMNKTWKGKITVNGYNTTTPVQATSEFKYYYANPSINNGEMVEYDDIDGLNLGYYVRETVATGEKIACGVFNGTTICLEPNKWQGTRFEPASPVGGSYINSKKIELESAIGSSCTITPSGLNCSGSEFYCGAGETGGVGCGLSTMLCVTGINPDGTLNIRCS